MWEQNIDLQKKFNLIVEERNKLSARVKELEDINFKDKLFEHDSHDIIAQSPYVDLADSECSFKTALSYIHVDVRTSS